MINAIKNSTLTDLQVKTLNIREKELNYWSTTFQTMASQSALLAGFCYGGLSMEIEGKVPGLIQFGYLATTTGGMGFGLLCITIAALVSTVLLLQCSINLNIRLLVWHAGAWTCAQRWRRSKLNA